jgi:hypothetical protein
MIGGDRPDLGGNLHHGDLNTFCPVVWQFLIDRYAIHSVLDVGCGEGHAVDWFNRHGVYAVGIEGLWSNVVGGVHPIVHHDITQSVFKIKADMVWSCEVAEHIDEQYVGNYLATLANARIVAMTHALPGQAGYHHVNLQPPGYWIAKMEEHGYTYDEVSTTRARALETSTYFRATGLIFTR